MSLHGERAWYLSYENTSRLLGMMYYGAYAREKEDLEAAEDDFIYIGYNFHWENRSLALPNLPEGMCWKKSQIPLFTEQDSVWRRKKNIKINRNGPAPLWYCWADRRRRKMRSWHPWLHFRTITRHKLLVMKYCFRIGLYKQGLLHDLSKYSPDGISGRL